MTTPAGWYQDVTTPGQQRYFDGTQWTEHVHVDTPAPPAPEPVYAATAAPSYPPPMPGGFGAPQMPSYPTPVETKKKTRKWPFIVLGGLIAAGAVGAILDNNLSPSEIEVGMCVNVETGGDIKVKKVDCAQPHQFRVVQINKNGSRECPTSATRTLEAGDETVFCLAP